MFNKLWIAFKFWLYWDWKQPITMCLRVCGCCELLSNFGYIGIGNNESVSIVNALVLWIAFKFWLYWDWKQPLCDSCAFRFCCELLSNFGYIGIGNNFVKDWQFWNIVVNCFQILAILGLETTELSEHIEFIRLWIAFKFWLYWDWKQPIVSDANADWVVNCFQILAILGLETTRSTKIAHRIRCELLSNFGYIGIGNNILK